MKHSYPHDLVIILIITMALLLVGCGSSDENIPTPQANQVDSQATADTRGVSDSVTQPTSVVVSPTTSISQSAQTDDTPDTSSGDGNKASLGELIVGSWVSVAPDSGTVLDFTNDGRFVRNSTVTSPMRYELVDTRTIDLFDGTGTNRIEIDKISASSMVISKSPWMNEPESFQKLSSFQIPEEDILGFWYADGYVGQEIDVNAGVVFPMMYFSPDNRFVGFFNAESTYEFWSDSLVVVDFPDLGLVKPLRFRNVSPNEIEVLFLSENDELESPNTPKPRYVTFTRLGMNEGMQQRLMGSWNSVDGFEGEFTQDQMFKGDIIGDYHVYGDGVLLIDTGTWGFIRRIRFLSDDELEVIDLDVEETGVIEEVEASVLNRVR